jgi:hypothetical protein
MPEARSAGGDAAFARIAQGPRICADSSSTVVQTLDVYVYYSAKNSLIVEVGPLVASYI